MDALGYAAFNTSLDAEALFVAARQMENARPDASVEAEEFAVTLATIRNLPEVKA